MSVETREMDAREKGGAGASFAIGGSLKGPRSRPVLRAWASLAFSAGIMIGAVFWPPLGLVVPLLVVVAALGSFRGRRWFCSRACPRAGILSGFLPRLSRHRAMPPALRSESIRRALCGLLMLCAIGQTARLASEPAALGRFFWLVCLATFGLAVALGLLFKPRSWCAVCPMGTLQDSLAASRGGAGKKEAGAAS